MLPLWSPIKFVPPSKDTSRKTVEQKRLTNRSHEEAFRLHTAPWRGASPPDLPFRSLRTPGEGPGCDSAFEPAHHKKGLSYTPAIRSEEHTSELQSLMRISYAVFCLQKKKNKRT